jgi:hypothetical protein
VSEVVYRSEVDVERAQGALRYAHLPAEEGAVAFGVHGAVAAHYYHAAEGTFEPMPPPSTRSRRPPPVD